ncbi:MAG: hypothetical protein IPM76_17600 [Chloroflexi bacterium]|nr:hypothetical protein [Chloroflexota bacterium]
MPSSALWGQGRATAAIADDGNSASGAITKKRCLNNRVNILSGPTWGAPACRVASWRNRSASSSVRGAAEICGRRWG